MEQHRQMNVYELEQGFIPVMPQRRKEGRLGWKDWVNFRKNMLTIWTNKNYGAKRLSFNLLNQHYFVCNSSDTVRRVFLDKHNNYDRKSPQMRNALAPLLGDGLFVSDGKLWRQRRKTCSPPFEKEFLPGFSLIMSNSAKELVDSWQSVDDEIELDVLHEMARLTAQIIGRTIFGDDIPKQDLADVVNGFTEYQKTIDQSNLADTFGLPFLRYAVNPLSIIKAKRATRKVHKVIDNIIDRYDKAEKTENLTLLSVLLDGDAGKSGRKGCPLSASNARSEAIVMFMAGHETTANVLAWSWYLLDGCPRSKKRMYDEIDTVLKGRSIELCDVENLPYTRAVFEETLRLYPPVPVLSRQAKESDVMRSTDIHPGSIMLVLPWLLHRHDKEWSFPNTFYPERFLPTEPKPDKFIYIPFSVGPRVCLGLKFGLTEGIICLATIAQQYNLSVAPGHKVDIECHLTLRPKDGLPMLIRKRDEI